jgi:hypothetical protein
LWYNIPVANCAPAKQGVSVLYCRHLAGVLSCSWHRLQPVLFSVSNPKLNSKETFMSSLSPKDRVSLCSLTFSDGRRCRTPRIAKHPYFCFYHAQKVTRARTAKKLGKDLAYYFSGDYLSASDLSTALARLIPTVVRGDVKPKIARTVAYLFQTLLQAIHISQDEYINAFDTDGWRNPSPTPLMATTTTSSRLNPNSPRLLRPGWFCGTNRPNLNPSPPSHKPKPNNPSPLRHRTRLNRNTANALLITVPLAHSNSSPSNFNPRPAITHRPRHRRHPSHSRKPIRSVGCATRSAPQPTADRPIHSATCPK